MSCLSIPEASFMVILVTMFGGFCQNWYHFKVGTSFSIFFKLQSFSVNILSKKSVLWPYSKVVGIITYLCLPSEKNQLEDLLEECKKLRKLPKVTLRKMCFDLM